MNEILDKDLIGSKKLKLEFKGEGSALFGIFIVNMFLTVVTLGIYYAWAVVKETKYMYNNTKLEGTEFEYHATGMELFIGYLKTALAVLVVYAALFGIVIALKDTPLLVLVLLIVVFALLFGALAYAIHGSLKFTAAKTSWNNIFWGYFGDLKEFVILFTKGLLLCMVTMGIYGSWFTVQYRSYIMKNLRFGDVSFDYNANPGELFMIHLKGILLSIITFGIYAAWYMAEVYNFHVTNTTASQNGRSIEFNSSVSGWNLFVLNLTNVLFIVFTLGFAFPWVICRTIKFHIENMIIIGDFRANELKQVGHAYNDATGLAALDYLNKN